MKKHVFCLGASETLPDDIFTHTGARVSVLGITDRDFRLPNDTDGFFVCVNKKAGASSNHANIMIRKALNRKDTGFSGTLDPFATGLLIIGVGKATKLLDIFHYVPKTYHATALLGVSSDTLDSTGTITTYEDTRAPEKEAVILALEKLRGTREQKIPAFSAKKIDGVPLYKKARKGELVLDKKKIISVYETSLLSYSFPRVEFSATVGSGTYIRSLCEEIGEALHTHALCETLERTQIGPFDLSDSCDISDVEKNDFVVLSIRSALEKINLYLYKRR
jgi:tRNA pseudouridine55 synthase